MLIIEVSVGILCIVKYPSALDVAPILLSFTKTVAKGSVSPVCESLIIPESVKFLLIGVSLS